MKQKLLLFILPMLLISTLSIAQDRDWQIGTTSTSWPADLAQMTTGEQVIDGLTVAAVSATFGAMRPTSSSLNFPDGYTPNNEWPGNGSSGSGTTNPLPTRRYFSFPVTGPSTIKVWFRVNGTGGRTCEVSDGTTVLGSATSEDSGQGVILTATYNGAGGTIYVSATSSINYHRISVVDGVLGVKENTSPVSTNVQAIGNRVYVSNVKTSSEVNIYSITGALVKTFKTNGNTDFAFKAGLYVATIKTAEGQKSVKLLLN
ncbi:T9SS type A sorting domain-containing protein [Mariniflexile soesokkakense]|uniref:T9SS type A sorting domain-containing protein n=1 Tax=Mariniflexile soesokkakense TaxID=1343160 RepID=A0ABV0A7W2_9FLAO